MRMIIKMGSMGSTNNDTNKAQLIFKDTIDVFAERKQNDSIIDTEVFFSVSKRMLKCNKASSERFRFEGCAFCWQTLGYLCLIKVYAY